MEIFFLVKLSGEKLLLYFGHELGYNKSTRFFIGEWEFPAEQMIFSKLIS